MKSRNARRTLAALVATLGLLVVEVAFAQCPAYISSLVTANKTKLYLYYATSSDATFPEYDPDAQTSPLAPFDVADLDAGIGTTDQLRNRITDIVKEDYCEFDVEIVATTTAPSPSETRWQIVGLGTDSETVFGNNLFGVAQNVDLNDAAAQDYSRVYADSFGEAYGGAGGALNGANSTLERWATAIGHTTSHEAGHNFGLSHSDSAPRPGEDDANWHIMATGGTGLTGEMRAARNRHFGDREYEILGHNLGLRIKTLTNWDFVNPNAEDAHQLVLTLLSTAPSLTLNWFYAGTQSPWNAPTVAAAGTQSFRGTNYNRFTLTFSTPKAWGGGPDGVVPGGAEFHVGATFAEAQPVIVFETRLKDSGGANLNLHPRMVGFDAGAADLGTGDFNLSLFNPDPAVQLVLEDLRVVNLPRMASIDSMLPGVEPRDVRGVPVEQRQPSRAFEPRRSLEVRDETRVRLATFKDARPVDIFYDDKGCKRGYRGPQGQQGTPTPGQPSPTQGGPGDVSVGEIEYCPRGWALSLFPSTYVYLSATVVEPNARFWDRAQARYVNGPLRTRVFYQFSGIVPDFDRNGVDDLIDIRTNAAVDGNNNGIIDRAEAGVQQPPPPSPQSPLGQGWSWPWWLWLLLLLIALFLIWLLLRRRGRPATA